MRAGGDSHETPSRYVVGFDLGTTNSAVCYVDTHERPWRVQTFRVPQVVAPGAVEARDTLPSFHYEPTAAEIASATLRLPWQSAAAARGSRKESPAVVGVFAREQAAAAPGRVVYSAKSWLCHSGVDRTAALLPWHAAPEVAQLSPVEVSGRYLAHVRAAWDAQFPDDPLAEQDFVLTLPASFDEVARELTVRAAAAAGLPRVVLIEEPQAAFYAWIYAHARDWESHVTAGQKILVCDIGGGTSDFTLIRVRADAAGKVQFHRVAVGEHLILGGDNFDLALAKHIEAKLLGASSAAAAEAAAAENEPSAGHSAVTSGQTTNTEALALPRRAADACLAEATAAPRRQLDSRQWATLVNICRKLKEAVLGPQPPARWTVHLPGGGSRLLGGGLQCEVSREDVARIVLDGFFPQAAIADRPLRRRSGFQEFGLPFAPDPAITRYLAAFLTAHRHAGDPFPAEQTAAERPPGTSVDADPARPDIVLFNGGVFESSAIRARLLEVMGRWFSRPGQPWSPTVLDNERLDLAVARGAAYYGMVRRGEGVRIAAGLARAYYIGVESDAAGAAPADERPVTADLPDGSPAPRETVQAAAVCLLPAGVEPGQDIALSDRHFSLLVSEPVEFPLYVSSTRLTDRPGEWIPFDREQMTPLPPIRTVLQTRNRAGDPRVDVILHARLTEIGTLDLWCSARGGRGSWRLQFDIRSATQTDLAAHDAAAEREGFVDEATWQQCAAEIRATFGAEGAQSPEGLAKRLAAASGMSRNAWPTSFCRRVWEELMDVEAGRRRSAVHEARWLNLLGFALRPGYGLAVDDWRVAETWRALQGRFAHASATVRSEGWILWRRISGGLLAGQQQAVAEPLLGGVRSLHRQLTTGKGRGGDVSFAAHETPEVWRLLGALELLPLERKLELGGMLIEIFPKRRMESVRPAIVWAIGRLGARVPLYAPLNCVVPADAADAWLVRLLDGVSGEPAAWLAAMQLARRTDDRYREVSARRRDAVLAWLQREQAPAHYTELVARGGNLDAEEQGLIFGESLPKGLRLM